MCLTEFLNWLKKQKNCMYVYMRMKEKLNYLIHKFKNKNRKDIFSVLKIYLIHKIIYMMQKATAFKNIIEIQWKK